MQSPDTNNPKRDLGIKTLEPESASSAFNKRRAIVKTLKFLAARASMGQGIGCWNHWRY